MTNEATKILARIKLQDHIAAVTEAQALLASEYLYSILSEELQEVVEYLQEQLDNSPAEGTI
jgi:hypothetical protein